MVKSIMKAPLYPADYEEQKPVAWFMKANDPDLTCPNYLTMDKPTRQQKISHTAIPLYTTPQTKPLSDEEIENISHNHIFEFDELDIYGFARAIEAKVRGTT
jgi:hypothetical protein